MMNNFSSCRFDSTAKEGCDSSSSSSLPENSRNNHHQQQKEKQIESNYKTCTSSSVESHYFEMSHLEPFLAQIAGHGMVDGKIFMKSPDGRILKPKQAPPKGEREIGFYRRLQASKSDILRFVPEFFGVGHATAKNGKVTKEEFLILSDVLEGFARPSVVDIKIGERTWGPDASQSKRNKEAAKYPGTRPSHGFSVCGMMVHCIADETQEVIRLDREYGKALKTDEVGSIPDLFFDVHRSPGFCTQVAEIVAEKIRQVMEVFAAQTSYKIYASSLLVAYDAEAVGDFRKAGGGVSRDQLASAVNVKVIDFANAYYNGDEEADRETDENFVRGIRNILKVFTDFLAKNKNSEGGEN